MEHNSCNSSIETFYEDLQLKEHLIDVLQRLNLWQNVENAQDLLLKNYYETENNEILLAPIIVSFDFNYNEFLIDEKSSK